MVGHSIEFYIVAYFHLAVSSVVKKWVLMSLATIAVFCTYPFSAINVYLIHCSEYSLFISSIDYFFL